MIEVFINYERYEGFKDIRVTKPLNGLAGSFEFTTVSNDMAELPVGLYDLVTVKVDGEPVIQGYVDPLTPKYDKESHGISLAGYDKTRDIVDCSILANTQYTGPMNFATFCKKVLEDNGINDIFVEETGAFAVLDNEEVISSKPGKGIFEFLDEIARKKNVLLSTNGLGNLVLYNNTGVLSPIVVSNKLGETNNTIRDGEVSYDMGKRFKKIIVKSQGGSDGIYGMTSASSGVEDIQGEASDLDVKRNRIKVIISKTATDAEGCRNQAKWEVNKRRADSAKYSIGVKDHSDPRSGELYFPGKKVVVRDDFADISSIMLIDSVVWSQTLESKGTEIEFVANDAYSLQTEDPAKAVNKVGENIQGEPTLTVVDYEEFLNRRGSSQ